MDKVYGVKWNDITIENSEDNLASFIQELARIMEKYEVQEIYNESPRLGYGIFKISLHDKENIKIKNMTIR